MWTQQPAAHTHTHTHTRTAPHLTSYLEAAAALEVMDLRQAGSAWALVEATAAAALAGRLSPERLGLLLGTLTAAQLLKLMASDMVPAVGASPRRIVPHFLIHVLHVLTQRNKGLYARGDPPEMASSGDAPYPASVSDKMFATLDPSTAVRAVQVDIRLTLG